MKNEIIKTEELGSLQNVYTIAQTFEKGQVYSTSSMHGVTEIEQETETNVTDDGIEYTVTSISAYDENGNHVILNLFHKR